MHTDDLFERELYRGDASKIEMFDTAKSAQYFLLYTHGIYLTDSPEVAADYTLKDGEHMVYRDETSRTVEDLLNNYVLQVMKTQFNSEQEIKLIADRWQQKYYDDPAAFRANRAAMEAGRKNEDLEMRRKLFKLAKKFVVSQKDKIHVVRLTTGQLALVTNERQGYVTRFNVPDAYLAKTLHVDQPMPPKVLAVMRDLFTAGSDRNRVLDMRDADGKFQSFDNWVKAFKTRGIDFAWADDDARVRGGTGSLPDLETLWHGTHFGGSWFLRRENVDKFVAAMQKLGYVGLEYEGGRRVGAYTRGGGGHLHRAFVFWRDADINRFRMSASKVDDPPADVGLVRRARYGFYK